MPRKASDLGGIIAMLAATAAFVVGDSFMKIVIEDLPPFEVLFLRGIAASFACAVLVSLRAEWGTISGLLNLRALLRAAGETLTTLCYVVALARMPIADVIAVLQTAPLVLMFGAAIFLRERFGPARLALALVGFAGALMVAQPGTSGVSPAALLAFGAALLAAARDLIGRGVPTRIPVTVVIFATMLMVMVVAGTMSLGIETWAAPTGRHLTFLGLAGLFLALGHTGLLLAYRLGRTASVAPFFYCFALLGGGVRLGHLGRVAERSGPYRHYSHRRERRRDCDAQPATRPQEGRARGRVMKRVDQVFRSWWEHAANWLFGTWHFRRMSALPPAANPKTVMV
jgi:drug/metabolite transporter (DMT)-like permease